MDRNSILTEGIYLCYNGLSLYVWVGKACDPYFLQEIFKVNDFQHIDRQISEEEMFQGYETSAYLTSLYNIVTSFRY